MAGLLQLFYDGGAFMYAILAASVIGVAIMIERAIFVIFRYNINGPSFISQIQKYILSDNIDRAIKLCNSHGSAALSTVVKAGLLKANQTSAEIQNAIDEATLEMIPKLQKRTAYLSLIANVSTLIGLLGTIQGLIMAFKSMNLDDVSSRTTVLAQGIAVAMYTTAFGLIVAIPCMIGYGLLHGKTIKIIDEIDHYSVKLINLLTTRLSNAGTKEGEG